MSAVGGTAGVLLASSAASAVTPEAAAASRPGRPVGGGFVVNGRHLSFGEDPCRQLWVAGQVVNVHRYNAIPPASLRVWVQYGTDGGYGRRSEAEIRELLTHVPVWDGRPGIIRAARTLNADQFFAHAHLGDLEPGHEYHYRFVYRIGNRTGHTADASFRTAPAPRALEPFTFTAFADEGIPGPTLDHDPSLLPVSDWGAVNEGYDDDDPDNPKRTGVATTSAVIGQITRVRNVHNDTPSRFNLLAGDICYANADGDIQPIINPDGPDGSQPGSKNTPQAAANSGGWDYFDPWVWSGYFPMIEASAAHIPWMFATGNHDAELFSRSVGADRLTTDRYEPVGYGGHAQRLDLPRNGPSACPSVYRITYGNVGVLSVDANDLSWEIQGLHGYSEGTQLHWVTRQLDDFRRDPAIDFVVVFFHECAFSTCGDHSSDGGVRSALAPLFSRFGVDLAIQGHNHLYERTNPIRYDAHTNRGHSSKQAVAVSPDEPAHVSPAVDGTTYVVVGTAGTPRYSWSRPDETDRNFAAGHGSGHRVVGDPVKKIGPYLTQPDFSQDFETVDWSQVRYDDYGFIALDVSPARTGHRTTMTLRFIDQQGRELDRVVFHRTAGQVENL